MCSCGSSPATHDPGARRRSTAGSHPGAGSGPCLLFSSSQSRASLVERCVAATSGRRIRDLGGRTVNQQRQGAALRLDRTVATSRRAAPAGASPTGGATTSAVQNLVVGKSVPTPLWSTSCRPSTASRRIRYAHDGGADGGHPDTAACWGSSPTATRGRSDTCRSSPAFLVLGACPTSALNPPSCKATTNRDALSARRVTLRPCGSAAIPRTERRGPASSSGCLGR
jgi:hypothetical protein